MMNPSISGQSSLANYASSMRIEPVQLAFLPSGLEPQCSMHWLAYWMTFKCPKAQRCRPDCDITTMFGSKKNKEEHRYYLLPGMGRSNRQRHAQFLRWALAVGILVSGLVGFFIYYMNRIWLRSSLECLARQFLVYMPENLLLQCHLILWIQIPDLRTPPIEEPLWLNLGHYSDQLPLGLIWMRKRRAIPSLSLFPLHQIAPSTIPM